MSSLHVWDPSFAAETAEQRTIAPVAAQTFWAMLDRSWPSVEGGRHVNSTMKRAAGVLAVAVGVVGLRPGTPTSRMLRRRFDAVGRRMRYLGGRLKGVIYRLRGRRPEPDVIDAVLVDRVRSSLGLLEKRLDIPHVHVMAVNQVVLLHGDVSTEADAKALEKAVAQVSGVAGVESYLHVGLIRGDTRPSTGRTVHPPSGAYRALVDAAVAAGASHEAAGVAVRGILAAFAERIPEGERDHVAAHLPADVRALFQPRRRSDEAAAPRTVHELVARIAASIDSVPPDRAERIVTAVVRALRTLVPDEAGDVAAVLPADLRTLWPGTTWSGTADRDRNV
jgi:uncharacterized protein (DUF2267 family)